MCRKETESEATTRHIKKEHNINGNHKKGRYGCILRYLR